MQEKRKLICILSQLQFGALFYYTHTQFFGDQFSLYRPGWSGTHFEAWAGLTLLLFCHREVPRLPTQGPCPASIFYILDFQVWFCCACLFWSLEEVSVIETQGAHLSGKINSNANLKDWKCLVAYFLEWLLIFLGFPWTSIQFPCNFLCSPHYSSQHEPLTSWCVHQSDVWTINLLTEIFYPGHWFGAHTISVILRTEIPRWGWQKIYYRALCNHWAVFFIFLWNYYSFPHWDTMIYYLLIEKSV